MTDRLKRFEAKTIELLTQPDRRLRFELLSKASFKEGTNFIDLVFDLSLNALKQRMIIEVIDYPTECQLQFKPEGFFPLEFLNLEFLQALGEDLRHVHQVVNS